MSVVIAELEGRRAGLTVSSLLSLSLEPSLVGVSIARQASLYEVLSGAGEWGLSILRGDQDHLAGQEAFEVVLLVLLAHRATYRHNRAVA